MMNTVLRTVAFGPSKTGLGIGYRLYNDVGVLIQARTTSGVGEIGATGTFFAKVSLDTSFDTIIDWDTGEGTPIHVVGAILSADVAIQEETSRIRLIWNTLQNQSEVFAKILDAMRIMTGDKEEEKGKDVFSELVKKLDQLLTRTNVSLSDIESLMTVRLATLERGNPDEINKNITRNMDVVATKLNAGLDDINKTISNKMGEINNNLPKIELPDYKKNFIQINAFLAQIKGTLDRVPKKEINIDAQLMRFKSDVEKILSKQPENIKPLIGAILMELKRSLIRFDRTQKDVVQIQSELERFSKVIEDQQRLIEKNHNSLRKQISDYTERESQESINNRINKNNTMKRTRMALGVYGKS